MKLSVYNLDGAVVEELELSDAVFAVPIHIGLMHQVVVAHQANARVGTASTKTRAQVAGTTKKIYKQKGTGRARHGSRKVPLWKGGGVAHGPHPRSYEQRIPKKMRRGAIRSALSAKARDNQIILLQELAFERPRTKEMVGLLDRLPVRGKVLVTLDAVDRNVVLSARNIPNVHTLPARSLNTLDLLKYDYLVATVPAIRTVEQWLAPSEAAAEEEPAETAPRRRTRVRAEAPAAETEVAAAPAEEAAPARRRGAAAPAEEAPEAEAAKAAKGEPETAKATAAKTKTAKATAAPDEVGEGGTARRPRARRAKADAEGEASAAAPTEGAAEGDAEKATSGRRVGGRTARASSTDDGEAEEGQARPKRTRGRSKAEPSTTADAGTEEAGQ